MKKSPPMEVTVFLEKTDLRLGHTEKITHLYRSDGLPCSINKDPALAITRIPAGFVYFCHRCEEKGVINLANLSPAAACRHAVGEPVLKDAKPKNESRVCGGLPDDFIALDTAGIPGSVTRWARTKRLTDFVIRKHKIGYSFKMNRVVFPIYDYMRAGNGDVAHPVLVGWQAKCIQNLTKEERKTFKRPKYLTYRRDKTCNRLYFVAPKLFSQRSESAVVLVEDILSAVLVNEATANTTIALLGNYISYQLLSNYKKSPICLWLDPDMQLKSRNAVKRFKSLGFNIGDVHSNHDPKDYFSGEIAKQVHGCVDKLKGAR